MSVVLLLLGCGVENWCARLSLDCSELPDREDPEDADGDVWTAEEDCDDSDNTIYPHAPELCDGKDNDCDGLEDIEEGVAALYYLDSDGDGYGDPDVSQTFCLEEPPLSGWSLDSTDCNDDSDGVYPGAAEFCDEVDNDCDEEIDEGVTSDYYADADGDGYGDTEDIITTCTMPESGYAVDSGDCDDSSADIFPGANELCDGEDNSCDGVVDEGSCTWSLSQSYARIVGENSDDDAGRTLAAAGDVDHDGYDDVIIGAYGYSDSAGAAYVLHGPISGDVALASVEERFFGQESREYMGRGVAGVGDVNDDGYADILIGSMGAYDFAGAVYLMLGPVSGSLDGAELIVIGTNDSDYLGDSLAGAGDVDGDGLDDILISAWADDSTVYGAGAAYLFSGDSSGEQTPEDATASLLGAAENDYAGVGIAGVGDTNNDGFDDVVISAPRDSATADKAGSAYLLLGPLSGVTTLPTADLVMNGVAADDYTGSVVDGGEDVDGDGLPDLLISALYYDYDGKDDVGAAFVVLSGRSGTMSLSDADLILHGEEVDDGAGLGLSWFGDVDGDGRTDILIGVSYDDTAGADAGAVILGLTSGGLSSMGGMRSVADLDRRYVGEESDARAGRGLSGVGDIDGDGIPDALIGAPWQDDTGVVYLVRGERE